MASYYFVAKDSIVREIWGKADTILLIFAGASAEFALNKAVDWLYYTGKLPADPMGRLFSTVSYARQIVFSERKVALRAIEVINEIHNTVEESRGARIPEWAYRDVLFMLIDYSIRSYEILERDLIKKEKEEVFRVFCEVGRLMNLKGLPETFESWEILRQEQLNHNLEKSHFTVDLYHQYRKHLGPIRYKILLESQMLVGPLIVKKLLGFKRDSFLKPFIFPYKWSRSIKLDWLVKVILLPPAYKNQIKALENSQDNKGLKQNKTPKYFH